MATEHETNGAAENIVDPRDAAETAGLHYANDQEPGITRRRSGKGWSYRDASGARITDRAVIERINKIGIPPAYTDVWICPDARGHIQATGRDAKGRKQYRYHVRFREVRDSTKYEHMLTFAAALPGIRERIDADMRLRGLSREKVLATVVRLLETTMIRVGNASYARQNKSYGLTTLNDRHVKVEGGTLTFRFKGKSGKVWNLKLADRRVAKIVRQSQDLPGQHLFQYLDDDGEQREVTSSDVNDYLREISGERHHRKGFPHLDRNRSCGAGTRRVREVRQRGCRQEERPCRDRASLRAARQHARGVPTLLRSPRGDRQLHVPRADPGDRAGS